MSITRVEQQVLIALNRGFPRSDPLLQALLNVTDLPSVEIGVHVTLLVNGLLLGGNLMSNARYTEHLDEVLMQTGEIGLANLGDEDPRAGSLEVWMKQIAANSFSTRDTAETEHEEQHRLEFMRLAEQKGIPWEELTFSDLTPELQLAEIARMTANAVLTLDNAVIQRPINDQQLGRIRVHLSQIAAWWVTEPPGDASGSVD
jgi:hypothetical protein